MFALGPLAFTTPWLLAALIALPVLWWLLRAIPPSPKREVFAGVRLLLGLEDSEREAARTPWWLILLRALALAAVIVGFAGPVLHPSARLAAGSAGPALVIVDDGWASAPDWPARHAAALAALDEADQAGRPVVLWLTAAAAQAAAEAAVPAAAAVDARAARRRLEVAAPHPWEPDHAALLAAIDSGALPVPGETIWFHDGLAHGPATAELLTRLAALGPLRLVAAGLPARAVTAPRLEEGRLVVEALRPEAGSPEPVTVIAYGTAGDAADSVARAPQRPLSRADGGFGAGETRVELAFDLPPELAGRVRRVALAHRASSGGAALAEAGLSPVAAAIVAPEAGTAAVSLISPKPYLREALVPFATVREALLDEVLADPPGVIVLADWGDFTAAERAALTAWLEEGGLLIRFAGERLAAAVGGGELGAGAAAGADDPLLPVRLRRGGRVLGGALSWGAPRALGPFDPAGPFRGLVPSGEVTVRTQVLSEPSPDLAGKVWATLADGTPLVTGARRGRGHVVLFHVSADPDWSSLPLSGLFVEMLGRLMTLAPGRTPPAPTADELAGTLWRPALVLAADGSAVPAGDAAEPVPGERLGAGRAGPGLPPGLYRRADSAPRGPGVAETVVVNLFRPGDGLAPFPPAPAGAVVEQLGGAEARRLGPLLIALAVLLGLADLLATLALSGRLSPGPRRRRRTAGAATGALALAALVAAGDPGAPARAETPLDRIIAAAAETTLGYVLTGDPRIDRVSERGLVGLGLALARRTSVEPGPPMGVDPATDELSVLPVLYWPLGRGHRLDDAALERLARYTATGGLLLIDTRDGGTGFGGASAAEMRRIARALNLPPLAPVDTDHVLTRTFYLLNSFPGRWRGTRVWAEAPSPAELRRAAEGEESDLPQFDRVDDDVSPVVVGSADWAAAWAVDESGRPMFAVGRPGDNQRELAIRFGINLVMYALTGNYKSDQVHAPAVLERLGQ